MLTLLILLFIQNLTQTHSLETESDVKKNSFSPENLLEGPCPDGWLDASFVNMGCLLLDQSSSGKLGNYTWDLANSWCQGFGGALVEIANEEQLLSFSDCSSNLLRRTRVRRGTGGLLVLIQRWTGCGCGLQASPRWRNSSGEKTFQRTGCKTSTAWNSVHTAMTTREQTLTVTHTDTQFAK